MSDYQVYEDYELEEHEVTCGHDCGHWDELNQCCWLSWWNKQEGDYCNYGLVMVEGEIYTSKELKALKGNPLSFHKRRSLLEGILA